jgi:ABC-type polysaccharide/polyol phosphate transport system ATPase subunit
MVAYGHHDVTELAVRCAGLSKRYRLYDRPSDRLRELLTFGRRTYGRDFWALRDLALEIPRGCVYGLVGRNGAGKSTALKMLAGRLRPTAGTLVVNGRISCILELGMGLNPNLTGRQNARVLALFLGLDPWRIDEQLDAILDFAELGEFADQPLAHYSTGMKARLSISALTALEPEVLILDEALATGDTGFATKCREFVRGLCKSGCTTILVSHDLSFMAEACDRIAWLKEGRLAAEGSPSAVIPQYLGGLAQDQVAYRPRTFVLRLEASADSELLMHSVEWEGPGGALWGAHLALGAWAHLRDRAAEAGLSRAAAERGWGEVTTELGVQAPVRRLRLVAGEVAFLAIQVPAAPAALPVRLLVVGSCKSGAVSLQAQLDGERRPLGELRPNPWFTAKLDVRELFQAAPAAATS